MVMTRRKWLWLGAGLTLLGLFKLALISWYLLRSHAEPAVVSLACPPVSSTCLLPDGVRLRFLSVPQEGQAFSITLDGVRGGGVAPAAEFSMRNMDMGFNRYRFVPAGTAWRASVILPVCSAGRHDWLMLLKVNGQQVRLALPTR
jgi:hypothetical protein